MYYKKRSQVTIFMIIGIVVLFTASLMLYLSSEVNKNTIEIEKLKGTHGNEVQNFVQGCLELVGDKAVEWALIQGGTYEIGTYKVNPLIYKLAKPIEGSEGIQKNPSYEFSKDSMDVGIKSFFLDIFFSCVNNFDDFEIPINYHQTAMINATVGDNAIVMDIDFPITIYDKNREYFFNRFSYRKNIEIEKMVDIVNQIVDKSVELNDVPTDLINNLVSENDITSEIYILDEDGKTENIVYFLKFEDGKHTVGFVINYDWL